MSAPAHCDRLQHTVDRVNAFLQELRASRQVVTRVSSSPDNHHNGTYSGCCNLSNALGARSLGTANLDAHVRRNPADLGELLCSPSKKPKEAVNAKISN